MEVLFTDGFTAALARLRSRGGMGSKAAETVDAIYGRLLLGMTPDEAGNRTNHGESRIAHAVKYDLPGFHRLVGVIHDSAMCFIFVGSHADVDRWLDENRGFRLTVDRETSRVVAVRHVEVKAPLPKPSLGHRFDVEAPLMNGLGDDDWDALQLKRSDLRRLELLTPLSSDDDILGAIGGLEAKLQDVVLGVIQALRRREPESARAHIREHLGQARPADGAALLRAVDSGRNSDTIIRLRDLSPEERDRLLRTDDFKAWMLFLHPEQKPIATDDFDGPVLLRGVSGSGKTCVVVHRAKRLAEQYSDQRIAVVTLSKALAALIQDLLASLCGEELTARIDVLSMGALCHRIIEELSPGTPVQEFDPRSDETLEDCWIETFGNPEQERRLEPIVVSLAKSRHLDSERYIRDEFTWVRSAFGSISDGSRLPARSSYLDAERVKRAVPFSRDWRQRILESLGFYEQWSAHGGFYDPAALALFAHSLLARGGADVAGVLGYRALLVDEVQDLGRVELEILRMLAPKATNGLFLAGDARQQVHPKLHDLKGAGIEISHRRAFRKNFRNPKRILEAGVTLMNRFGPESSDEIDVLDPEYSDREGPVPVVVGANSEEEEIRWVADFVNLARSTAPTPRPVCIVACGIREDDERRLDALLQSYRAAGLQDLELLDQRLKMRAGSVVLSALEPVKGFEFSLVLVTRCNSNQMPDPSLPEEEAWRDAARLYVALTRARDELVFTCAGAKSQYLEAISAHVRETTCEAEQIAQPEPANTAAKDLVEAVVEPGELAEVAAVASSNRSIEELGEAASGVLAAMAAEAERLRAENAALRWNRKFKVSPKGGLSVYGLGRYPVTLYRDQWLRLLDAEASIRNFIDRNGEMLAQRRKDGGATG